MYFSKFALVTLHCILLHSFERFLFLTRWCEDLRNIPFVFSQDHLFSREGTL